MKLGFISDTHFQHANIIKYSNRPYSCVEEMNEAIIDGINKYMGAHDILYHLGDFMFGGKNYIWENAEKFRRRLNVGTIHYCWGNHDHILKVVNKSYNLFSSAFDYKSIAVDKYTMLMMHYPIEDWDKKSHGSIHLHGHQHQTLPWHLRRTKDERIIDVGVDSAIMHFGEPRPFFLEDIVDITISKKF